MQYAEANIIFPRMQIPDNISANNNSNLNNILNFKPMFTENGQTYNPYFNSSFKKHLSSIKD